MFYIQACYILWMNDQIFLTTVNLYVTEGFLLLVQRSESIGTLYSSSFLSFLRYLCFDFPFSYFPVLVFISGLVFEYICSLVDVVL